MTAESGLPIETLREAAHTLSLIRIRLAELCPPGPDRGLRAGAAADEILPSNGSRARSFALDQVRADLAAAREALRRGRQRGEIDPVTLADAEASLSTLERILGGAQTSAAAQP